MQDLLTTGFNSTAAISFAYFLAAFVFHVRRRMTITSNVPPEQAEAAREQMAAYFNTAADSFADWHARPSTHLSVDERLATVNLAPVPPAAKTMKPSIRFTIPDAEIMPVVASAAIDWSLWKCVDLRWVATRLGVKGAGHMNTAEARAAVEAAIA